MINRTPKFYANVLQAIKSYKAGEVEVSHYPMVGYIEPSTHCNLRCPSCPTGLKAPVRERANLSYEKFVELIDEWGEYLMDLYMYNWGEPFMNTDFIRMVKYATDRGILVHTSSNMNKRLTEGSAEALVLSGLTDIKIGVDGLTQETYEMYRRRGSLEKVLNNVRLIAEAKHRLGSQTPVLLSNFHVFAHNEHEINAVKPFLMEKGMDSVALSPAFLPEPGKYGIMPPTREEFRIENAYQKNIPDDADVSNCTWLWFVMVYNPNGTISPCCGVTYEENDFARPEEYSSLLEAYNSERYQIARGLKARAVEVRYDGSMGLTTEVRSLKHDEVICSHCQAPYIMDNWSPEKITNRLTLIQRAKYMASEMEDKLNGTQW